VSFARPDYDEQRQRRQAQREANLARMRRQGEESLALRQARRDANMRLLCLPSKASRGTYSGSAGAAQPKENPVRSEKLRQSARGEECLVRLPGCPADAAMTIWSHYRGGAGGKGKSIKATDIAGAYACTHCDGIYDGQTPRPAGMTKAEVDLAWLEGHVRSLVRLQQKGLL
jgi:hypothetical protein